METEMENGVQITAEQAAGIEVVDTFALRKLTKDRENLTEVCFPDATVVDVGAFAGCENLRVADFPKCVKVEASAFEGCQNLEKVNLPLCKKIGTKAFYDCEALQEIDLPLCIRVLDEAFRGCQSVELIHLPVCESIGAWAFTAFTASPGLLGGMILGTASVTASYTSVKLPVCKEIGKYAFGFLTGIKAVSIPVCESVGDCAFQSCVGATFTLSPSLYEQRDSYSKYKESCIGGCIAYFGKNPRFVLADED